MTNLFAIFLRFFKFGLCAWGGPVAQINMMKEECVDKEKCITLERFKRTLAVYQALPGPEKSKGSLQFWTTKDQDGDNGNKLPKNGKPIIAPYVVTEQFCDPGGTHRGNAIYSVNDDRMNFYIK